MRHHHLTALFLGCALASPAMALAVTATDNFNSYADGSLSGANGGTGWTGAWAGSSATSVANGGLNLFGNGTGIARRTLDSSISGNALISFDFTLSAGTLENNDFLALWLGSYTGPNIGLKANCGGSAGCTDDLFVRTGGVDAGGHTQDVLNDSTYSVLGYLQKTGGSADYNRFDLWINPSADEVSTLTGSDAFDLGASGLASFNQIGFRGANLDAGDVITIDNLRVSAVPEPGSLALLGTGLALMLATARRRMR